jgi:hypothetical protein
MKALKTLGIIILALATLPALASAQGGTWTTMNAPFRVQDAMLMMDGTVLAEEYTTGGWWRLTPDASGSYVNGTWSDGPVSSMPTGYAPLYYCSAVLPDGRLVIIGGEYNFQGGAYVANEQTRGAIYTPSSNTWADLLPPAGVTRIGDSMCTVLPTGPHAGQLALGPNSTSSMYALDPATLTWTNLTPTGKTAGDRNSEEGWTLLPDGTLFVVSANVGSTSQRYLPSLNQWVDGGASPVALRDSSSHETGAQVMMYNGSVFAAGAARATGANAVFNPPVSSVSAPATGLGTWTVAPPFPTKPYTVAPPSTTCTGTAPDLMCQLDDADAPGVALTNGRVLVPAAPGVFNKDSYFFEYDPTDNSLNEVARPDNASTKIQYQYHMLLLPTGQVFAPDGSAQVQVYTIGSGGPSDAWRPVVTTSPKSLKPGSTYSLSGMQLNGLTEGAYYGDDYSSATNYPIVQITNRATGHVFWGNTHDRDNVNITPDSTIITTQLDVPAALESGTSDLVVIANGIPSASVEVNQPPAASAAGSRTTLWPPNGKLVPVVVTGTITDSGDSGIDPGSLKYTVVDEYGIVQPSGSFTLHSNGAFSFTVMLAASRHDDDFDGRKYQINVSVSDNAGNPTTVTVVVIVPHDQGR